MCGICGIISNNSFHHKNTIELMNQKQFHRGPDANGIFSDGYCSLGHTRLSIIDLSSSANQPMFSHNDRYVIVYNGEVYNFKEIAKEIPNFTHKTNSDTEVIIEAFSHWGVSFVNRLNGMFAIAIYDKIEKNLFVFRDRIGKKPIYYYNNNGVFAFASELKALTVNPLIKDNLQLNYKSINLYLHLGYIPEPYSIYDNIYKFPSANYAKITSGKIEFIKYWDIRSKIEKELIYDENEALTELDSLLNDSVRMRLYSDVPFGVFLSGGIDSSIITAIASKNASEKIKTFCIKFPDSDFDESIWAKNIASYIGTNHFEYEVTHNEVLEILPKITDIYDEPFSDSSTFPTLIVSKFAKKQVTMALSGDGGDELFWGYGAYKWINRLDTNLLKPLKIPMSLLLSLGPNKYKRASNLFKFPKSGQIHSHVFSQEQYCFLEEEVQKILKEEVKQAVFLNENFDGLKRSLTQIEQQAIFDIEYYLKDDLMVKVDRASMYHSIETRSPLLDYRVVEFALNLSPELKIKNSESKYLLKKLLANYIPPHLFDRRKMGFSIQLNKWLKNEMSFLINDYLSEEIIQKHRIFEYKEILKLKNLYFSGKYDYLYQRIWLIIVLNMFLEKNN